MTQKLIKVRHFEGHFSSLIVLHGTRREEVLIILIDFAQNILKYKKIIVQKYRPNPIPKSNPTHNLSLKSEGNDG